MTLAMEGVRRTMMAGRTATATTVSVNTPTGRMTTDMEFVLWTETAYQ